MIFLFALIGYFAGEFLIGGILFAVFGNGDPNSAGNKMYGWIGKVLGVLLAVVISKNM